MAELGTLHMLTLNDPKEVAYHGRLVERHYPHALTPLRRIPDHPGGIPNAAAGVDALPYIEAFDRETVAEVDALCISCAFDPGVEALGEVLDILIVGASTGVTAITSARGEHVGTLGLENRVESAIRDLLGDRLAAEEVVKDAVTTSYLMTDEGRAAIRAAVDCFVDAGCGVIAPSRTDIFSSGTIPNAQADAPVPITDPVATMSAVATIAAAPSRPPRQ